MIVYIDEDFMCHTQNDGTMMEVDTNFFDGKCAEYIEGYIFVPKDKSLTLENGAVFHGEFAVPWKPYAELDKAQRNYEKQLLAEYSEALKTLGVTV